MRRSCCFVFDYNSKFAKFHIVKSKASSNAFFNMLCNITKFFRCFIIKGKSDTEKLNFEKEKARPGWAGCRIYIFDCFCYKVVDHDKIYCSTK